MRVALENGNSYSITQVRYILTFEEETGTGLDNQIEVPPAQNKRVLMSTLG